jgi:dCTP deaminase
MFWNSKAWLEKCNDADNPIVVPFDAKCVADAKYELAIGDEVYVSAKSGLISKLSNRESFAIDPGQFAFLLTAETLSLPQSCIGFISIRAKTKFMGLVNISGFHVDPGYQGKLIFAVFNAGPSRIHLKQGERIFSIWLADLTEGESRRSNSNGYDHIPPHLVSQISSEFTTAYQVKTELDTIKDEIHQLKLWRLYITAAFAIFVLLFGKSISDKFIAFMNSEIPTASLSHQEKVLTGQKEAFRSLILWPLPDQYSNGSNR